MEINSFLREQLTSTMVPVPSCLDLENRGHSRAPDLPASQEKEKQSGTKLETALVALNQSSSSQPVITQLLWVASQARFRLAPLNQGHPETFT